ncbi:MAG: adenylate/guanylate cyclase domain-containing protein, partial [Candidatus Promineifilaceae bacterium]
MIVCPHCAHDNPADARFCQNCGRPLERACPHCGTPNGPEARFCKQCGRPLPGPQADQASGRAEAPLAGRQLHQYIPDLLLAKLNAARALGQMVGERRLATILFCDVEGSTALAERLDPEDWADIMNGAFERLIAPIYRFEGTLARLMGDAILAFFGAPIAHEDDPQRAVLAGLEILEAMQPYQERVGRQLGMELHVRIGVNTGLVVVGEMGSDLRLEYTAMGDAVNVAARMEQTAAPDTLQIAHDTYRLVAPLFETQPLGPTEVKGKSEPVPAYRVLAARKQPGRLRGIEGLDSPLVGRERELGLLSQALEG